MQAQIAPSPPHRRKLGAVLAARLSDRGFDVGRLPFTLRTAVAACLAFLIGWLIGLEHPQWSAMTVWAASQPLRGQLIEKSLFRVVGTVIGVAAGVLFLVLSRGDLLFLVVSLAIWTAVCTAAGNLLRSYVAYGAILAGYSAAMVALLDYRHPEAIGNLAADRLLTVLIGVLIAGLAGMLLAPRAGEGVLGGRTRALTARLLETIATDLGGREADARKLQPLLSEAALIEELLDSHAAGSLRSHRRARTLRDLLAAQVAAIVWLRRPNTALNARPEDAARPTQALLDAAHAAARADLEALLEAFAEYRAASPANPPLAEVLRELEEAVRAHAEERGDVRAHPPGPGRIVLHRDWIGAREAAVRALAVMLLMGGVWLATGWSTGPYLMLGASIMTSVFSAVDHPARTIAFVLRGTVLGVVGALACRWLVWPFATSELQLVLLAMPFVLLGPFVMTHRATSEGAFDYNMHLLLLLSPVYPLSVSLQTSLGIAAAVVAGPAAALVGYRLIFPATLHRRVVTLATTMVRDLETMARSPHAAARADIWRARLRHRVLRLARLTDKAGAPLPAIDGGLAILELGESTLRASALSTDPALPPSLRRAGRLVRRRMANLAKAPLRAERALRLAAARLEASRPVDARLLEDAARALGTSTPFLARDASSAGEYPRR